ncbi:MAG: polysaccharide biosynthesis tyrosine autokinase [Hyphomonadaceae bacterium]|nr:polysaccharide biosynthesis tyrosine autokinase [Hyphomonadaceae bacterium]
MNKQTRFAMPRSVPFTGRSAAVVPGQDGLVDIKAILTAVRKRFWLATITFLLSFAAIATYTLQQTPIYQTETRLMLDTRQGNDIDLGSMFAGLAPNTAIIDTELEVMQSETMLSKVVDTLNLTQYAEFNYTMQEPSGVKAMVGDLKTSIRGMLGMEDDAEEEEVQMSPEELQEAIHKFATWKLRSSISVSRLGPTYIIDIRARSENPELAALMANAVAEQYIVEQLEAKLEAARRQNLWLSERLEDLRTEVNAKESAVEEYRTSSGLLTAQGSSLTEQQISDLTRQQQQRQSVLSEAESRLNDVRIRMNSGSGVDAIAEVLGSQEISNLRQQQAEIQRRAADLATRYGPLHPERVAVNNELADVRASIDSAVSRVVSSLESQVAVARSNLQETNRQLGGARSTLISNNQAGVRLRELEREAEASRALYEDFLERFKVSNEQDALAKADARVLTEAGVPGGPASPKVMINLILGFMFGGAAAGAVILVSELRENHFSHGEEIERALGVPSIGAVPLLVGRGKRNPGDYAIENPLSAYSESIRNIRASIVFADLDNPAKTVAICSSLPNEAKTMTSYSLGRLSALSGSKTLVIDGDFRRRQLTEAARLDPEAGLIEHLFGEVALDDAIHVDDATGMHVLPLTSTRNTPRDVFGSRAFDALLQRLETAYDLIVIDTGPLLLMAESRVIVSKVDQVIVVAKWRSTTRQALQQTINILQQFNASIAGVALTFVDLRKKRFLGTSSASYKAYSKYYSEGSKG